MNSRMFALTLTLIAVILALAFLVRTTGSPSEPAQPTSTNSTPIPQTPPTGGALTFRSADGITSVTFDAPKLTNGLVTMENPTTFYGTTTAFEQTFNWKLTDDTNVVISEGFGMTSSSDIGVPGPFTVTMLYDRAPVSSRGTLMVYEASAQDGTPIHVVNIPVMFAFTQANGCASTVKIAMRNAKKDPNALDCAATELVERKVCGTPTLAHAIHELLQGPTEAEKAIGYETNLAEGTRDPQISRDGAGYRLNFDGSLQQGVAGSCRVGAIRAQIEDTVMAFDAAALRDAVRILVNGNADETLQP
jgi:hypothetical protein